MDDHFTPHPDSRLRQSTDEELVAYIHRAHAAGADGAAHAAFRHVHYRHQRRVIALLNKLPADHREDVAQEVFLAAYEAAAEGTAIGNVGGWLTRVARNHQASFWRGCRGQHVQAGREGVALDDPDTWTRPSGEGGYERAETEHVIDALLARRSETHRAIVRMAVLQGYSAKEVEAATGESTDNVYQVAKRFRDELRTVLRGAEVHPSADDPGRSREDRK